MIAHRALCVQAQHHLKTRVSPALLNRPSSARPACQATPKHTQAEPCMELDPQVQQLVSRIHGNQAKAVLYVTGGAVQATSWLLSVPGASNTVLECAVPYARDSLVDILGQEPEQYCSEATAIKMAIAAYKRAASLTSFGTPILGLSATCALATVPMKKGEHRAYIACHDGARGTFLTSLTFAKGARSRVGEDAVASMAALQSLAHASGEDTSWFHLPLITSDSGGAPAPGTPPAGANPLLAAPPEDQVHHGFVAAEEPIAALLAGRVKCVEFAGGQVLVDAPRRNKVLLPGSFNPLHRGHEALLQAAIKATGGTKEGSFELSVGNADKGALSHEEVHKRVAQFTSAGLPVVLTRAPLFTDKADLLPGSCFVVGYDTAIRLVMPKYYKNSETSMFLEFARLRNAGCSFLVAGRKDNSTGSFKMLGDVQMPPALADLFMGLTEEHFRVDLSSTELRASGTLPM